LQGERRLLTQAAFGFWLQAAGFLLTFAQLQAGLFSASDTKN
jgi:hypothetical protein